METLKKRILIIEDAPELRRLMEFALNSDCYALSSIEEATHALEITKSFKPDLIILDIMMPGIHGLEALKQLKADPLTRDIGVFICSGKKYKPDIDAAFQLGASDYITKPFEIEHFKLKVDRYFSNQRPQQLQQSEQPATISSEVFLPALNSSRCYFRFWGCRGSVPVAGHQYLRYGGNTPCFELGCEEELIVIDAGTGIRELGMHLMKQPRRHIHLFIGHTHWDHIQGFPFFTPVYEPNQELFIYGAAGYGKDLKSTFRGQLASEYFPIQLEDMKATMKFIELESNPIPIGNINVYWEYVHHPGAALGFKIDLNGKTIVYITDNEFLQGYLASPHSVTEDNPILNPYRSLLAFIRDADILISEAQYPNEEYIAKVGWGHTSLSNACLLAKLGNVKRWIITHHDPMHDDYFLDQKLLLTRQLLQQLDSPIEVSHAYDGMMLVI